MSMNNSTKTHNTQRTAINIDSLRFLFHSFGQTPSTFSPLKRIKKEWAAPKYHIRPQSQHTYNEIYIWVREGRLTPTTCLTAIHIFYLHLLNLVAVPTHFHSKANDETKKKNGFTPFTFWSWKQNPNQHTIINAERPHSVCMRLLDCCGSTKTWLTMSAQPFSIAAVAKAAGVNLLPKKSLSELSTRVQDKNDYIRHIS